AAWSEAWSQPPVTVPNTYLARPGRGGCVTSRVVERRTATFDPAREEKSRTVSLPVISLFSGVGGLDMGVERCGGPALVQDGSPGPFRIAVASDYEPKALETFTLNHPEVPTVCGDIRVISARDLMSAAGIGVGDAALVIG